MRIARLMNDSEQNSSVKAVSHYTWLIQWFLNIFIKTSDFVTMIDA